jgi:hypothetical protein
MLIDLRGLKEPSASQGNSSAQQDFKKIRDLTLVRSRFINRKISEPKNLHQIPLNQGDIFVAKKQKK